MALAGGQVDLRVSFAGWSCLCHLTPQSGGHSHHHQLHKATCAALRCANLNLCTPPTCRCLSTRKSPPRTLSWMTSLQTILFQVALPVSPGGEGGGGLRWSCFYLLHLIWHIEDSLVERKSDTVLHWGKITLADSDERLRLSWKWMVLTMDILLQPMTQSMHNMVKHIKWSEEKHKR